MAILPPLEKILLQSRESDADAEMSSSSLSEEDALEYNMSEDLEDSPAVISPPPSSKPEKANKYKNRGATGMTWAAVSLAPHIYNVFRDLIRGNTILIFMDDFIIPACDEIQGLGKLKRVLREASEYGLEINFKKCQFLKRKIEFLGYVIEEGTVRPSPSKTTAVQNFPQPKNVKQMQSFLGLTEYFRKFVPGYSKIAKPLSDMLRNGAEFEFGPMQRQAFDRLKELLCKSPVLHIFQQGKPTELHTDASSHGFGAVLLQRSDDGELHPIHHMSKKTSPQQENCRVTNLKCSRWSKP
ncbi:Transposon Tf2-6 polyprotein [Araneus ventricosus]|uniref:Transposon Tf2-6 polyprotein n=1 Tax=Araneus ventricosus TaxID=182803 RepID=A0A4Y2G3M7_ARAVE|nr:Transposon Tf2-6 polyprotein [Araneus ventricosus]